MSPWKPLDSDPGPRPVNDSLDSLARRLGAPRASSVEAVFARWEEVVGESVASHAQPRSLRRGTLVVAVDDPAWASELRSLIPAILERCAALAGADTVRKIDVRVRP
jgi:predicted nucleic acid-binding Zn ribbon protein